MDKHIMVRIAEENLRAMYVNGRDEDAMAALTGDTPHLVEIEPGLYRLAVPRKHAAEPIDPVEHLQAARAAS